MKRALILVEGQTEEIFVKQVLAPHLWPREVDLTPTIVATKRVASGPNFKGGLSSWDQLKRDLERLRHDTSVVAITTLLDYYGLPTEVPGVSDWKPDPRQHVTQIQSMVNAALGDRRFRCYVAVHEFEAMLYAAPATCGEYLGAPELAAAMKGALRECGEPELVNNHRMTAPSKRILAALPSYDKVRHGPTLAGLVGVERIRAACPNFDTWVTWLESL